MIFIIFLVSALIFIGLAAYRNQLIVLTIQNQ